MELSAIFCDGMILQRRCENKIYGVESTGISVITVTLEEEQYTGEVMTDGHFEVVLPPMEAGGPYTLTIVGSEEKRIQDVWIGDVYLLSGQSNMELPVRRTLDVSAEEIAQTRLPLVRQFLIPMSIRSFDEPLESLCEGSWVSAEAEHIMEFSAVGLFFAKEMYAFEPVAIGLVMTAVGGSTVEAWMDRKTLEQFGHYEDKIKDFYDLNKFHEYLEMQEKAAAVWREKIADDKSFLAVDAIPQGLSAIQVPCMVAEMGWKDFHGSLIYYRELELTEFDESCAYIYLGAVIESDEVWINGKTVGETGYRYPPRKYPIPEGVLQKGKNIIAVRIEIEGINGGFVRGMPYYFYNGYEKTDLSGEWYYRVGNTIRELKPEVLFPPVLPAGLFNSSLAPLKNTSFRAVLWYQGESNDKNPQQYFELFQAMTKKWRELFGWEIPFFTVQLSGFRDPVYDNVYMERKDSGWGEVRDQQRQCAGISKVYIVPSMDVGEFCDLHPQNKKAVGMRLANAVKKELCGTETHYEMPVPESVTWLEDCVQIQMKHLYCEEKKIIHGFEILSGKEAIAVSAVIRGNIVEIQLPKKLLFGKQLILVYDWEDCPECFELVNEYGVISGSFAVRK